MSLFCFLCFDFCKLSQWFKSADFCGPQSQLLCKCCTGSQQDSAPFLLWMNILDDHVLEWDARYF